MSVEKKGGEGFLSRWARLKEQARAGAREEAATPAPEKPATAEAPAAPPEPDELPPDLEDIDPEALDPENVDFSRFLKEDVPEWLRRKALRKLWQSDPVLANLDGLNDYDEDFTEGGVAAAAHAFFQRLREMDEALEQVADERREEASAPTAETASSTPGEEKTTQDPQWKEEA